MRYPYSPSAYASQVLTTLMKDDIEVYSVGTGKFDFLFNSDEVSTSALARAARGLSEGGGGWKGAVQRRFAQSLGIDDLVTSGLLNQRNGAKQQPHFSEVGAAQMSGAVTESAVRQGLLLSDVSDCAWLGSGSGLVGGLGDAADGKEWL